VIVAIQGERGSFSEGAARKMAGDDTDILSCATFDELFSAVATGRAHHGAVPVNNTIAGPVYDNADRAQAEPFVVVERMHLLIRQCLIARHEIAVSALRRVASHPMALRQCSMLFRANPECIAVAVHDTAGGVRELMMGQLAVDAVIGSSEAARLYGATILREGVEDTDHNFTEFVLISAKGARFALTPS
jgi:prephenate dehydratase